MFHSDPSYYASAEAIRRYVLGQGMRVTKSGGKFRVNDALQMVFDNQWMIFLADVLRHLSIFGFCVVDKRPNGTPFVRSPLELEIIEIRWRSGRRVRSVCSRWVWRWQRVQRVEIRSRGARGAADAGGGRRGTVADLPPPAAGWCAVDARRDGQHPGPLLWSSDDGAQLARHR